MDGEREELVKHAFPQLRKMCETRGVTWSEVDLRWGVTEEAVAEDRAAEICLREVDRCHPFFIGILGTHYGPLTAQEIERGALDQPANTLARFYFRAGVGATAIEELKARIHESGLTVRDGYRSPQELSESIRADFEQLIEKLFPASGTPNSEDVEQNSFALSHTTVYVERPALNDVLDRHFMDVHRRALSSKVSNGSFGHVEFAVVREFGLQVALHGKAEVQGFDADVAIVAWT